jgi:D-sedoheptulose 7-phosphate isomerase
MNNAEQLAYLKKLADESCIVRKSLVGQLGDKILQAADFASGVIGSGGKLLVAGNGGSASMSSHFVTELVVRLSSERERQALPAIALSVDPGVVTAAANDYGFENIFARQVEALGNKGDMLIVMSTSGNSPNLIRAVQTAMKKGVLTLALLGGTGGKLAGMVERSIIVPHPSTQRIQEEHLFLVHVLVEKIESDLFA